MSDTPEAMLLCVITPVSGSKLASRPPLIVNGVNHPYQFGEPVMLSENVIAIARACDSIVLSVIDAQPEPDSPASEPAGSGDAAASEVPGGDAGGGDSFDPELIITGTVGEVEERLANLTLAQLAAVEAAETDREVPRVGVANAIAQARKAFAAE